MKFKLTYPEDYSKTMKKVLRNETEAFKKIKSGVRMRILNKVWERKMGTGIFPEMKYKIISKTEAEVEIITGVDCYIKEEAIVQKLKKYEKASEGNVKVDLIEN